MMQKPFQLTAEMAKEIDDEISSLAPAPNQNKDDPTRYISRPKRLFPGTQINVLPGEGVQPGPSDDKELPEGAKTPIIEDPINPAHYRSHPSGIECIEVTRHMTFNLGNCLKYIWRVGQKNDIVEDLKKAQWYLDDEIRRLEGKR